MLGIYDTLNIFRGVPYKDNQILIISSRKHTDNWGLPKGGWEIDETVEEAARREIGEETGVFSFSLLLFICIVYCRANDIDWRI